MVRSSALDGCSQLRRGHARSGLPRANPAATERSTRSVVAILALPELAGRKLTDVERKKVQARRLTCLNCGRTDRLGFADETVRQSRYGIAVVVVCHCRVALVRKVMRGLVRPDLRRVHFSKQQDGDRRLVVKHIVLEDIQAFFATAHGRQIDARSECWINLVPQLVAFGVTELAIERIQAGEARDRRDIRDALKALGREDTVTYRHVDPAVEPMLWVADAVAWCVGAGSHWRTRIASILVQ